MFLEALRFWCLGFGLRRFREFRGLRETKALNPKIVCCNPKILGSGAQERVEASNNPSPLNRNRLAF